MPTVLQMESTECGAASLAMILAYYKAFHPLDQIRAACGVARDGSTARDVVRAARDYGLTTRALACEPDRLRQLKLPLIVHWRFDHFLVVEGWFRGGWHLNDPAMGPRQCLDEEFDESFTGVVIEAQPGDGFVRTGRRPALVRRLLTAAGDVRPLAAFVAAIVVLLLVPMMAIPSIVQRYGDTLAGVAGITASAALVGLSVALALQTMLLWLQGASAARLASRISVRLDAQVVHRLLRLPASYHAQRGASTLAGRAALTDQLSIAVSALVVTASSGVLTAVVACAVLLLIDPVAGLVAVGVVCGTAVALRATLRRSQDSTTRLVRDAIAVGATVTSSLSQFEAVKASGLEDGVIARGLAAQNRLLDSQQRVGEHTMRLTVLSSLVITTGTTVIAAAAAWRIASGALSPGAFLAILALAALAIGPLASVVLALEQAQSLGPTLDQVDDVLATAEDAAFLRAPTSDAPATVVGELELRSVAFGYAPAAPPVIEALSLHIKPGSRVALVGPSGCGKSTVSRLVTGLYEPWTGSILIDGRPRAEHARQVLTDRLGLVDQDVFIFAGTIRDNVTLWDPSIPERDVLAALADAQLTDLVDRRPGGLDAVLAEAGIDLSGGQRQRLEIARALARNPVILVLDEATSALDPATEQAIDVAIRRRGISVLVIAHRLSTIRDCDEIIVLDAGRVVERGTHDELLAAEAAYSRLVAAT